MYKNVHELNKNSYVYKMFMTFKKIFASWRKMFPNFKNCSQIRKMFTTFKKGSQI